MINFLILTNATPLMFQDAGTGIFAQLIQTVLKTSASIIHVCLLSNKDQAVIKMKHAK